MRIRVIVTVLADVLDPDGRRVVLDDRGWTHVVDERGEMAAHSDAVIATVTAPHHRLRDRGHPLSASGVAGWAESMAAGGRRLQRATRAGS